MTREEKKQARIEFYEAQAAKAKKAAADAFSQSSKMSEAIPFGQPILIGHHSEKRDRNYRERIFNKMGQGVKLSEKADYYENKAAAAESNNAIYIEDENSVERLTEKVEKLKKHQAEMKEINKVLFTKNWPKEKKVTALQKMGYSDLLIEKFFTPSCFGGIGFESYQLTNNNARIKAAEKQLEKAKALKTRIEKEYTIAGVKVVENPEENRLQLFFDGKPSEAIRTALKHNGFRWSPFNGCWQAYLNNNSIWFAKNRLESLL